MRKACGDRSLAEANELLYRGGAALANSSSTLVYPAMSDETPTTTPEPTLENLNALANWLIPTPVRMDCFFVTLAVLLGTNVNALSSSLGMPVPQPGSTGVQSSQIVQALVSLGLAFRVWTFREPENGGGGPIRGRERGVSERHWGSIAGMPNTVGIGYRRPDRTGHVVICRSESSPKPLSEWPADCACIHRQPGTPYSQYLDFQQSRRGADVASDVANSEILFVFWVDTGASHGRFFDQHRRRIEQVVSGEVEPMEVEEQGPSSSEPMEVGEPEQNESPEANDGPNESGYWKGRFHDEL